MENEEDGNLLNSDEVISLIADKMSFTKSDVKEILIDGFVWVLEQAVKRDKVVKIYGLGKLYSQEISIKDKNGGEPKIAKRHIFRLAKNIRHADREKP
jgi:nucleoid DNA-binding protein